MITPEVQAEILTLYFTEKQSVRAISVKLGVHRRSVQRVIDRRAVNLQPTRNPRHTILEPYREHVRDLLRKDPRITGTALLNAVRAIGYTGGIWVVREYARKIRQSARGQVPQASDSGEF